MQFNQLESFVSSAKYLSFSRAAEDLYISQPSVSLHVLNLERQLGVKLFSRENKNLKLTPYGEFFLPLVEEILYLRDSSKERLLEFVNKREGSIHLISSSIPASQIVPSIVASFIEVNPDANIRLSTYDSRRVCSELLEARASLGIVGSRYYNDSIVFDKLLDDEIIFISSKDLGEMSVSELMSYNIISREAGSGTREEVENALLSLGFDISKLKINIVMEDSHAIISLVRNHRGIGYISKSVARDYIESGKLFEVKVKDFKVFRSFYFAHVKDRALTNTEEDFKKFVLDSVSKG